MPAYNEEATIEEVVKQWYPILEGKSEQSKIIIADSGSTDATHDILLKMKSEYPKLDVLEGTLKQHGPKLIAMYSYAIKNGADWIFQTDSDGQTNPDEFEDFWAQRNDYEAIIGCRKVRGDGLSRKVIEVIVCILLNLFFGIKVPDANAPFRLMRCSLVDKYIGKFDEDYNLPNIMLTAYYSFYKENISFKEITFKPRQGGVNSINIKKIVKIGMDSLKDFYAFRKDMRK